MAKATWVGLTQARPEGFGGPGPILAPPVTARITVAWGKGRKRMDGDNLLASLKRGCIDVIAQKIGVDDKHFIFQPVEQTRDKEKLGYMVVTLEGS